MSEDNQNNAPDEAAEWYRDQRQTSIRQVESQLSELANGYSAIENTWRELDEKENRAHDELDTRSIVAIQSERQRLTAEANQIRGGWDTLQARKESLERIGEPEYASVLGGASEKAKSFLQAHRHSLENNPDALRQLLYADARARAVGIRPDSDNYFNILETAVGLPSDSRDDFPEMVEGDTPDTFKISNKPKAKSAISQEQRAMAHSLPGVDPEDYLKACANPFSQASQPVDQDFGQPGMKIDFEEKPKQAPQGKYRAPDPRTSVTLSPAELEIIDNMATATNRPVAEVRREFAKNKIALHSGKAGGYQLYADKIAGERRWT